MAKAPTTEAQVEVKPVCGIIMPIAAMPPKYDAAHWIDVRRVIDAAIIKADMTPQIVSDSFEGDVIQRRIINNLYDNPVVVCDVSGLNPNVMFELGMRITFKQPVVIITDDYATIPFDTKVIEHLGYPRDLHIHHTTDFIEKLADRIKRQHEQKKSGEFTSFIEAFGTFEVLEPTKKVVEADQLILDRLDSMERSISRLAPRSALRNLHKDFKGRPGGTIGRELVFELERDVNSEDFVGLAKNLVRAFDSSSLPRRQVSEEGKVRLFLDIDRPDVSNPSEFIQEGMSWLPADSQAIIKTVSWG